MSFSTYYQSCWNNKEWMGDYSQCCKSTPLAGLTFLLAFFFLYVIYGKPLSPCKIKFPEMYSFIFFSKACPFLHNRLIISQNTEFTIKSYLKPQKLFMWLTEFSVARYTLFLWIIKKGEQCEYIIRPGMNRGAWQCYIQTGGGSAEGRREEGVLETPAWCDDCSPLFLWHGPKWTEEQFPVWSTNPRMPCEWANEHT